MKHRFDRYRELLPTEGIDALEVRCICSAVTEIWFDAETLEDALWRLDSIGRQRNLPSEAARIDS